MEFFSHILPGQKSDRWSVPSASLQIIKTEGTAWNTRWSCCHSERPWQAGEMGSEESYVVQQRVMQSSISEKHVPICARGWVAGKHFTEKNLGVLVERKQDDHEPAVHLHSVKAKCVLAYIRQRIASRPRKMILPLYSALTFRTKSI